MKTTRVQKREARGDKERLAKYRTFVLPSVDKQIASMSGFLVHRAAYALMSEGDSARAAGRAWIEDALILATMPAENAAAARRKITHISEQLTRWAHDAAADQHQVAAVRALDTVIAFERTRWGLDVPDTGGEPNLH